MNIGLDFDGVIINNDKLKMEVAREHYGLNIPSSKFRTDLITEFMTLEKYEELKTEAYGRNKWVKYIVPVQDSLAVIKKLLTDGHNLKIITSRSGRTLEIAKEWLRNQNLGHLPIVGVGYQKSKAEYCRGLDIYVDDDLVKLDALTEIVPQLLLFTSESNQDLTLDRTNIKRTESWHQLYNLITLGRA